jgi:flavin-dependent dehydrogenase
MMFSDSSRNTAQEPYDVLIVGGGPASGSAAIYTARKGLRTGIVADRRSMCAAKLEENSEPVVSLTVMKFSIPAVSLTWPPIR